MFKSLALALARGPILSLLDTALSSAKERVLEEIDGDADDVGEISPIEREMSPDEREIAIRAVDAAFARVRTAIRRALGARD